MSAESANSAMAPQTLLESPEVFRLLVDSVADYAIFLLDAEGMVSSWNPGAERLKQYKAEEIVGRHFSVFYTQHDLDEGRPAYELRVAGETGRFEDDGWGGSKGGSRF